MKIYTKAGDKGTTTLCSDERIEKCDIIFEVLGTIDELTSHIGLVKVCDKGKAFYDFLEEIQKNLIKLMSGISVQNKDKYKFSEEDVKKLEEKIDESSKVTGEQISFVLPGKSELSARLDVARTVARRAERCMVKAAENYIINDFYIKYMNRLSDFLYIAARYVD